MDRRFGRVLLIVGFFFVRTVVLSVVSSLLVAHIRKARLPLALWTLC